MENAELLDISSLNSMYSCHFADVKTLVETLPISQRLKLKALREVC
jgi:hypothetical protein